jgi:hypothetical protein
MRFASRLYYLAVEAIDIGGADQRASFSKLVLIAVLILGTFFQLPVVLGIACIAASFGLKTFTAFLNRGQFNANASTNITLSKAIQEIRDRRDPADGIEPTK